MQLSNFTCLFFFFFFNDPATTDIYTYVHTLSLHDALPISSDATFLLQRLLERRLDNAALGPFWDPVAVSLCFDVGVGATLPLRVGGKTGPMSGQPLDLTVEVLSLQRAAEQDFGRAKMPEIGRAHV